MSQEENPREPEEPTAEELAAGSGERAQGPREPSDTTEIEQGESADLEQDEPAQASARSGKNPAGGTGPRLHAVPPHESKRRSEFQAGSDLSELLAKKQLDFDSELRRRPEVRSVEFQQIGDDGDAAGNSLDMLMDIRLPITVELGRTQMLVRDILDFGPGTVIELDKLAGDPVDVLVNGKIVAQGEVVVADDHFGVRITTLLSPQDRVRSLA